MVSLKITAMYKTLANLCFKQTRGGLYKIVTLSFVDTFYFNIVLI